MCLAKSYQEMAAKRKVTIRGGYFRGKSAYYDFIEKGQRYVGRIGPVSPMIAKEIIARKRAEVIQGRFGIKANREGLSFRRFVNEKYLPIFHTGHRPNTVQITTRRCREFVTVWGDRRIQDINVESIERWKHQKLQTCKPSSVHRYLQILYNIFEKALEWGYIERSPMYKVKLPAFKNQRKRFLTVHEEKLLLAALPDRYRKVVLIALNAGLRESEVCYLTWMDVDFKAAGLTVRAELSKNKETQTVPMTATVRRVLAELKPECSEPEGRIFGRLNPSWLRVVFHRAVQVAGLTDVHFHDLRHTFASRLIMKGADIRTVQELMRHNILQ
jgi:integrase